MGAYTPRWAPRTAAQLTLYESNSVHMGYLHKPLPDRTERLFRPTSGCHQEDLRFYHIMQRVAGQDCDYFLAAAVVALGREAGAWTSFMDLKMADERTHVMMRTARFISEEECLYVLMHAREVLLREQCCTACSCPAFESSEMGPFYEYARGWSHAFDQKVMRIDAMCLRVMALARYPDKSTLADVYNSFGRVYGSEQVQAIMDVWLRVQGSAGEQVAFDSTPLVYRATGHLVTPNVSAVAGGGCSSRMRSVELRIGPVPKYDSSLLIPLRMARHEGCAERCHVDNVESSEALHMHLSEATHSVHVVVASVRGMVWNVNTLVAEVVDAPYVVVSHVWAHGLFRVSHSHICQCSVELLRSAAKSFGVNHVWVDTLCLPVYNKDERRAAIQGMYNVYTEALAGVIVDYDLLELEEKDKMAVARLFASDWNSRVWTLQEGIMVNDAFVYSRHGLLNVRMMVAKAMSNDWGATLGRIGSIFGNVASRLVGLPLSTALSMSQERSTSKKADRFNGIAALVGAECYDTEEGAAYCKLLKGGSLLDHGVLYRNTVRLKEVGFCWAPRHEQELVTLSGTTSYFRCGAKGIHATIRSNDDVDAKMVLTGMMQAGKRACIIVKITSPDMDGCVERLPENSGFNYRKLVVLEVNSSLAHYVRPIRVPEAEWRAVLSQGRQTDVVIGGLWGHPLQETVQQCRQETGGTNRKAGLQEPAEQALAGRGVLESG